LIETKLQAISNRRIATNLNDYVSWTLSAQAKGRQGARSTDAVFDAEATSRWTMPINIGFPTRAELAIT
jgi:hypothetical protein